MNPIRHVLSHINDAATSRAVLALAATIARRHDAELGAVLAIEPIAPGAFLNAETASLARQLANEHRAAARGAAGALLRALQAEHARPVALHEADGDPVEALKSLARCADLLVVGQQPPSGAGGLGVAAAARLLVGAGAPVLVVPHIGWPARADGAALRRVLLAWSDTRECARAWRDALPLLARADAVELLALVDGDEAERGARAGLEALVRQLGRHGVAASASVSRLAAGGGIGRPGWVPDASVAEALLSHAADTQAELIVMGGYGHSRAWQFVLGGVTRTMLQSMTVPVLFSH